MSGFPLSMRVLVDEIAKMPGIGRKSAQRLAFHLLRAPKGDAEALAGAIMKVRESVRFCSVCYNLSDDEVCQICRSPGRDRSLLCIVEEPDDIITIERAGHFNGIYHVLLGSLSPLDGIGPADLKMRELTDRVRAGGFVEAIIATDFTTEGEATALYLARLLAPAGIRTTRMAYGIPVGGGLEHADQATIAKAFEGRRTVQVK